MFLGMTLMWEFILVVEIRVVLFFLQDSRRVIQELESKTQQLSKQLKEANEEKSVSTHVVNRRVTCLTLHPPPPPPKERQLPNFLLRYHYTATLEASHD